MCLGHQLSRCERPLRESPASDDSLITMIVLYIAVTNGTSEIADRYIG